MSVHRDRTPLSELGIDGPLLKMLHDAGMTTVDDLSVWLVNRSPPIEGITASDIQLLKAFLTVHREDHVADAGANGKHD